MIQFNDLNMNQAYELSDSIKSWKFCGYRNDGQAIFGYWNGLKGDEEIRLVAPEEMSWLVITEWRAGKVAQ